MIERSIRISDATYKKIKKISKSETRTIKAIVDLAIENYLMKGK